MSFKDGRIGVGKDPIFPLDISGSARIDGDLVLGGRFSDSAGNPILLGGGSGATSTPQQNQDGVPSWSSSSLKTSFSGNVGIGIDPTTIALNVRPSGNDNGIKVQTSTSNTYAYSAQFLGNSGRGLTVVANGAVGIGTTTLSDIEYNNLRIVGNNGNNGSYQIYASDAKYGIYVKTDNESSSYICGQFTGSTGKGLQIRSNGNAYFTGGNVGIGTSSPYVPLHASCGTFASTGENSPQAYNTTAYANVSAAFTRTNSDGGNTYGLFIGNLGNTGGTYLQNLSINNNNYYNLLLQPNGGNVGIGTTSPGEKLCVNGSIQIKGSSNSTVTNESKLIFTRDLADSDESEYIAQIYTANYTGPLILEAARGGGYVKTISNRASTDPLFVVNRINDSDKFTVTGNGRIYTECSDQYIQSWNRSGHSQWWTHIENSYFTIHRNGVGHCGRFYASTNENGLVFNRACRANYTQYYTNYSGWNAGLLCGAGPMGGSSPLNWTASYACVFTTNGNLHLDNKSGKSMYLNYYSSGNIHLCSAGGKVTIGGSTASAPLHVHGYASDGGQAYWISRSDGWWGNNQNYTVNFGAQIDYGLWVGGRLGVASDRRIKENIVDVPDHDALEMLRNIPCRYYEYKDKVSRGIDKTIGFIAQEVREKMPMAVSLQKSLIPNEMRKLENISWEEITDNSTKRYKLTSDLSDCNGIIYRFFVSNEPSGNDECKKEIIGNQDDTFTFEKKWNNVFCYGKEVDDFHVLDKQKLFALNFSATQELDKQQLLDKAKIETLTKENYDQNVKILDLCKENESLKARLAKIESFLGL